jgi:hypothetical protein
MTSMRLRARRALLPRSRFAARAALVCVGIVVCATPAAAQPAAARESQLKAGYIYNFTRFVAWPDKAFGGSTDPLVIVVVGRDPFDGNLGRMLEGKNVGDHPIAVETFGRLDAAELARSKYHVLFVSGSESGRLRDVLDSLRGRPILTVSDLPDFGVDGGMIGLYHDGGTLQFEINRGAADEAGLKLSSKMLGLARLVNRRPKP